uniref:USP domain-containing protein n=1 Tax=Trichogramma kaykai TaxID=54128 RepID=A0ABD2WB92_9HYME
METFNINLTKAEWEPIKPCEMKEKDRIVLRLQPGWGDTIIKTLRRVIKIPYNNCNNTIIGSCVKPPLEGECVEISIKTKNSIGVIHTSRRRLANSRRRDAKKVLEREQPILFKHLKSRTALNDSGTASPFYHSSPVLSTARQEARDEKLHLKEYPGNPLDSLVLIAIKNKSLQKVSTDPVIVWYWSENQIELSREVFDKKLSLSIDSAGCFVRPVGIIKDKFSAAIFLYNISVNIDGKIFSLVQMLSSKHDTETVLLWLLAWMKSGAPAPYEIVSDCSKALLNALCLAFNQIYYSQYLDLCFNVLQDDSVTVPKTLVKRDRNHLIKSVARWKILNSSPYSSVVKDFYLQVIAFSLEITEVKQVEKVLIALFIMCTSETIDKHSVCGKYFCYLEEKIATFDYSDFNPDTFKNQCLFEVSSEDTDLKDEDSIAISIFIKNIQLEWKKLLEAETEEFSEANPYYVPDLVNNIVSLFLDASELYYRIMRSNYGFNKVISINRFLLFHLEILLGATRDARLLLKTSSLKNHIESKEIDDKTDILNDIADHQSIIDNNAITITEVGSVSAGDEKIEDSVFDVDEEIEESVFDGDEEIEDDIVAADDIVDNLKPIENGSNTPEVIYFGGQKAKFMNTCAFDSIFELMIHSAKSNNTVKKYFEKYRGVTKMFQLFHLHVINQLTYQELYKHRAKLLHPYVYVDKNKKSINCETNVNSLFFQLLGLTRGSLNLIHCEDCYLSKNDAGRPLMVQDINTNFNTACKDYLIQYINTAFNGTELNCKTCDAFPCFREQPQNNWQSDSQATGEYWRSGSQSTDEYNCQSGSQSTGEYCQSRSQTTGEYWQSRSQTTGEYWPTPNWTEKNLEGPINTLSSEFSNDDQASWQNCAFPEESQSSLTSIFGNLLPTDCQEESVSVNKSFLEKNLNEGRNLDQPKKRNRSKDPKVLTRKKPRMESNWIDNKAKKARAMGVEGIGRNGKIIQKREMGPGCKIDCRFECHTQITTEERKNAFALFWGQGDRAKQWRTINNWTNPNKKDKIDKSNGNDKTKSVGHYFTLPGKVEGSFVPVCRTMFLKTLDISNQMIRTADLKKKDENELFKSPSCRMGKHKNRPHKISNENLEEVRKHIKSFPPLDSHYCRATSTKQYLDENLSITKMYELYKIEMDRRGLSSVNEQIYRRIFTTEFNLDFYVPKKDKCEKCERFSKLPAAEQIDKQQEQALHLENKNIIKDLIESDRPTPLQDPFLCVANFDLQKTLNVPKADIGPLYYMTKLVIWNFTIFEMGHKIGHCNVWNETVGRKGANEIVSFLWDFIRQKSQTGVRRFIFYSDNCSGQNRNKMVFSMYFKAALDFNVSIVHRISPAIPEALEKTQHHSKSLFVIW